MCEISQRHSGSTQSAVMERPAQPKKVQAASARPPSNDDLSGAAGPKVKRPEPVTARGEAMNAKAAPMPKTPRFDAELDEAKRPFVRERPETPRPPSGRTEAPQTSAKGAAPADKKPQETARPKPPAPPAQQAPAPAQERPNAAQPPKQAAPQPPSTLVQPAQPQIRGPRIVSGPCPADRPVQQKPAQPQIRGPEVASGPRPGSPTQQPPRQPSPSQPARPPQRTGSDAWKEGLGNDDIAVGEEIIRYLAEAVQQESKHPKAAYRSPQWDKTELWKARVVSHLYDLLTGEPLSTHNLIHGGMREGIRKVRQELEDLFNGRQNVPRLPRFM